MQHTQVIHVSEDKNEVQGAATLWYMGDNKWS